MTSNPEREWCRTHTQWADACIPERGRVKVCNVVTVPSHSNYNTGELCWCDARFGFVAGPCVDEEPMITGTDPANGTG